MLCAGVSCRQLTPRGPLESMKAGLLCIGLPHLGRSPSGRSGLGEVPAAEQARLESAGLGFGQDAQGPVLEAARANWGTVQVGGR